MVASSASTDKRPDASVGGAGRSRPALRGVLAIFYDAASPHHDARPGDEPIIDVAVKFRSAPARREQ